jgi:phosphopantothenoylcysteine decarboxylase/phosphopantothenate--cysteine ligase
MFEPGDTFGHLAPGRDADCLLIAPATADLLARMAHGLASDMLACQALAFQGPVVVAPAMNPAMWAAPATQDNWRTLLHRGVVGVPPERGEAACGDTGRGRLARLEAVLAPTLRTLAPNDLEGRKILITLGPTREWFDSARYWSNPSTGRMGACLAMAAWLRSAEVTAVCGPHDFWLPDGIRRIDVDTAVQMDEVCRDLWPDMDAGCLTAAVADYRPEPCAQAKLKKRDAPDGFDLRFTPNPDILQGLGRNKKTGQVLVGFAAEAQNLEDNAAAKLESKNLDMIAANRVGGADSGFAAPTNEILLLDRAGRRERWPVLPKTEAAWRIWDALLQL